MNGLDLDALKMVLEQGWRMYAASAATLAETEAAFRVFAQNSQVPGYVLDEFLAEKRASYIPQSAPAVNLPIQDESVLDRYARNIQLCCDEFIGRGAVQVVDRVEAPRWWIYRLKAAPNVSVGKITSDTFRGNLLHHAEIPKESRIEESVGHLEIWVPRYDWKPCPVQDYVPRLTDSGAFILYPPTAHLQLNLGLGVDSKPVIPRIRNLACGGSTDAGKTNLIHVILFNLHVGWNPDWLKIILIDSDRKAQLRLWDGSPFLMGRRSISDPEEVLRVLRWMVGEMNRRFDLYKLAGKTIATLPEYNHYLMQRGQKPLTRLVTLIDEQKDVRLGAGKDEFDYLIDKLASLGQDAGISVDSFTQRPDEDTLKKANFPERLALYCSSEGDSKVTLGIQSAEGAAATRLRGNGDAILRVGGQMIELQTYYVDKQIVDRLVAWCAEEYRNSTLLEIPEEDEPEQAPPPVVAQSRSKPSPPEPRPLPFMAERQPEPEALPTLEEFELEADPLECSPWDSDRDTSDPELEQYRRLIELQVEFANERITEGEMYARVFDAPSPVQGGALGRYRRKGAELIAKHGGRNAY